MMCQLTNPCLLAVKPKLPDDFEEKTWQKLKGAVHAVQKKETVVSSHEELYRVWMKSIRIFVALQKLFSSVLREPVSVGMKTGRASFSDWRASHSFCITPANVLINIAYTAVPILIFLVLR